MLSELISCINSNFDQKEITKVILPDTTTLINELFNRTFDITIIKAVIKR